jgi:NADH:ubiquinone oxidoreductase subunit H
MSCFYGKNARVNLVLSSENFIIVWKIFLFIFTFSILVILLDEVLMGCWQNRIGPLNIGVLGILSALVNGVNLIIANIIVP